MAYHPVAAVLDAGRFVTVQWFDKLSHRGDVTDA
jgi:hypothetical protein